MAGGLRVWDLPVRLFHWALVALLGFSWWSGHAHQMDWHRRSGYTILALLVFRIYWGFAGSRTARFAEFIKGPGAVVAYVRTLPDRKGAPDRPGHNPLGGWSVAALMLVLIAMVGAGLFSVDVDGLESGPLADRISFEAGRQAAHVHHFVFNLLLGLVGLHLAAIAFYWLWRKQNLIWPMVTGRTHGQGDPVGPVASWRLAIGVMLAALVAWVVSRGLTFAG